MYVIKVLDCVSFFNKTCWFAYYLSIQLSSDNVSMIFKYWSIDRWSTTNLIVQFVSTDTEWSLRTCYTDQSRVLLKKSNEV